MTRMKTDITDREIRDCPAVIDTVPAPNGMIRARVLNPARESVVYVTWPYRSVASAIQAARTWASRQPVGGKHGADLFADQNADKSVKKPLAGAER